MVASPRIMAKILQSNRERIEAKIDSNTIQTLSPGYCYSRRRIHDVIAAICSTSPVFGHKIYRIEYCDVFNFLYIIIVFSVICAHIWYTKATAAYVSPHSSPQLHSSCYCGPP